MTQETFEVRIPLFKTLFAEVVTYDPVITKYNAFFFSQIALAVWHLVLVVIIMFNIVYNGKFNWRLFGGIWIGIDSLAMVALWFLYRTWIKSCSTLPFPSQKNRNERSLVIGKPMHATISRGVLAATIMYSLILLIFGYILTANAEFKGIIEHTIEITLLQGLLTFSILTIIALIMSIASQIWPLANVQDVMVCIPTTKTS